jgi:hypothetical protein
MYPSFVSGRSKRTPFCHNFSLLPLSNSFHRKFRPQIVTARLHAGTFILLLAREPAMPHLWHATKIMKHRFILYTLSHTLVLVDISEIGLPTEIYPPTGKPQPVSCLRVQTQHDAMDYLRGMGATQESLDIATEKLKKTEFAVVTVTQP